jgi:hypothetical protein
VSAQCDPELQACIADGGGGGAGGAGGAGGGGCDSCQDVINNPSGPSTSNICSGSQRIFDALWSCICGDATTPGMCN